MPIVHYQKRDEAAFDYLPYFHRDFPIALRGPRVPVHLFDDYTVALGSAATFGRFVHQPYAEQLTLRGLPMLNLGISGARPGFFARIPDAATLLGKARALVFEVVSARGYATVFFQPSAPFSNIGTFLAPDGTETPDCFVDKAWKLAFDAYPADVVEAAIQQSLDSYVADFADLATRFPPRVILLWFSQRSWRQPLPRAGFVARSGRFPHFVNADTMARLQRILQDSGRDAGVVDITSTEGLPVPLLERSTGKPASVITQPGTPSFNDYYPSQEMHDAAAAALWQRLRPAG